jgi:16S rRNA (uracil1498-N3)-methyltransferase
MRLNRFFVIFERIGDKIMVNDRSFFEQINKVLKLRIGEELVICDGPGNDLICRIESFGKNKVELTFIKSIKNNLEPKRKVVLYCSILKHDNFDVVAQKATEAGVYKIVPIISSRTIKTNIRMDRVERIIKEAAELSGRSIIPELNEPVKFKEALALSRDNNHNFFLDMDGNHLPEVEPEDRVGIFIGPEGGWSDEEMREMLAAGLKSWSLGGLTFRAETAAIIGVYELAK